jgi:hypothetical protein
MCGAETKIVFFKEKELEKWNWSFCIKVRNHPTLIHMPKTKRVNHKPFTPTVGNQKENKKAQL